MNAKMIATAVGIFAGGVAVGVGATRTYWEGKIREEYRASSEAMRKAYELARQTAEAPSETEDQLAIDFDMIDGGGIPDDGTRTTKLIATEDGSVIEAPEDGTLMITTIQQGPEPENSYHKALSAKETPVDLFVAGGVNDYGVSYIEEEEYLEDDGRFKGKIDIMMDDHNPIFIMDGQQIDDWDQRVGDSILVDFYRLVPPGADDVLYVRNHRTEEDYEVVRVHP